MVVSAPEEDPIRERERAAMAQQQQRSSALDEPAAVVNVPSEQHGEESRRGGRSRHDFSKREKHTKFGDYILGNTIGEGEFGKVKLGWKQEGGIQVSSCHDVFVPDTVVFRAPILTNIVRRSPSS